MTDEPPDNVLDAFRQLVRETEIVVTHAWPAHWSRLTELGARYRNDVTSVARFYDLSPIATATVTVVMHAFCRAG